MTAGQPRTLDELRERLVQEGVSFEMRPVIERLWLAVEFAGRRGLKKYEIEEAAGTGSEKKSHGHLSHVFAGRRQSLEVAKLKAYARACGVREAWLFSGDGPMAEGERERFEPIGRYPNAQLAAELARREGISDEAIGDVVGAEYHDLDEDAPPLIWLDHIRRAAATRKRKSRTLALDAVTEQAKAAHDKERARATEELSRPKLPPRRR